MAIADRITLTDLDVELYTIPLTQGPPRSGLILELVSSDAKKSYGDAAPLPRWSVETLEEAAQQIQQKKQEILDRKWQSSTCFQQLVELNLYPSLAFALESALLSLLSPLPERRAPKSALFLGSPKEILKQAEKRLQEGYVSAKLKVGHLSFNEAKELIFQLKDLFHLRIDVNRAWQTKESLHFFSTFALDAFDYVEEPFSDPQDLAKFTHPLAIDESFPRNLSLKQLEQLPRLKALIYKPTLQGGLAYCVNLCAWCQKRNVSFVLSSSFESHLGLSHIVSMANRLNLSTPLGLGTQDYLINQLELRPL